MKKIFLLFNMLMVIVFVSCNPSDKDSTPQQGSETTEEVEGGGDILCDELPPGSPDGGLSYTVNESSWVLGFRELNMEISGEWNEQFVLRVGLWEVSPLLCAPWQDREKYLELCQKVGDVNYKGGERKVESDGAFYYNAPFAIATNFTSIEIVAPLDDFDEEHPAGTLLNDLVRVRYSTLYPFIRDGYTKQPNAGYIDGYQVRDQKLTDITPEYLRLLGPDLRFTFSKTPPYAMKIFMQIILTDEYGQKHVLEKNIFNDNYEYKQPGGF